MPLLGCGPSYVYKLDERKPEQSCPAIAYDHRPEAETDRAREVLRRWLGLRIEVELLDAVQLEQLAGARLDPHSGYGHSRLFVASTLSTEREGIEVELESVEPRGSGLAVQFQTDVVGYQLFGIAVGKYGQPAARPQLILPWPPEILSDLQVHHVSGWEALGRVLTGFGHLITLGIFWWGPKLAGYGGGLSGGGPSVSREGRELQRQLATLDAWESQPALRAAERVSALPASCRASGGAPCESYRLLVPAAASSSEVDGGQQTAATLHLSLRYHFPGGCRLDESFELPLPAADNLAAQLHALWPSGVRPLDELLPQRPAIGAAPPRPLPPIAPVVVPPPAGPLPLGDLAVRLLDRDAAQQVLGLPLRPVADALLYACRVGGESCRLRIDSSEESFAPGVPSLAVAHGLLQYDSELKYKTLLGEELPEILLRRLDQVAHGSTAPLGLLLRRLDPHRPAVERLRVEVGAGPSLRQAELALPAGPTLQSRIERALAALGPAAGGALAADAARDCQLGVAAACRSLASADRSGQRWGRACTLGDGGACRQLATTQSGDAATATWRDGCLLGDIESCGELGRRPSIYGDIYLTLKSEKPRAGAYSLACSGGLLWACNDLAVFIGRIAEQDSENASRSRSESLMRELLTRACKDGDSLACQNASALDPQHLDRLKVERPPVAR